MTNQTTLPLKDPTDATRKFIGLINIHDIVAEYNINLRNPVAF